MSYRTLLEAKRLAADKPSVVMTLGEIREYEVAQLRKGDDNMAEMKKLRTTVVVEAIEDLTDITDERIEEYKQDVIYMLRQEVPDGADISVSVEILGGDAQ